MSEKTPLILQLNFPFCFHKCSYCAYPSCTYDSKALRLYAAAMVKEIEANAEEMQDYIVTAISIEGGSPGLMLPEDLQKVLRKAKKSFTLAEDCFISIQTMPGDYSRSLLDRMRDNGVNHYIFGIPTVNEYHHRLLKRPYSLDAITMADTAILNFNVRDLSFELLYGIPGQSEHEFLTDLERMLYYDPEHITLDALQLREGTPLYEQVQSGEVNPVSPAEAAAMYEKAAEQLKALGYEAYTIRDFAKPGHENRYRLAQLQGCQQLGFGYHAFSFTDGVTYDNGHSLAEYLQYPDRLDILADHMVAPDEESLCRQAVCNALTLTAGLDPEAMKKQYSCFTEADLKKLAAEGYAEKREGRWYLTSLGIVKEPFDEL